MRLAHGTKPRKQSPSALPTEPGYPALAHLPLMARKLTFLFCLVAGASAAIAAADLTPAISAAFDRYARLTEHRIHAEVAGAAGFLWIDTLPENRRADVLRGL